mgnify:CR=1 FL=1
MKKSGVLRFILLTLLFVTVLVGAIYWLGMILYPKMALGMGLPPGDNISEDYAQYYFGRTRRDSVDTVFIGSSHQFCSVDVNLLNREYGMNAILLTSRSQNLMLSYYGILESVELQHPKTVVLETCDVSIGVEEPTTLAKASFYDHMPNLSRTKWISVRASGDPFYLYYIPLTSLHGNWGDVRLYDLKLPGRLAPGERYSYHFYLTSPLNSWSIVPENEKSQIPEGSVIWLDRIVQLCYENGIELILYTAPYAAGSDDQKVFNALSDYAEEKGLRYYNLMHRMDEIGIDVSTDFFDPGHLNYSGQEKLTRYLAEENMIC